MMLMLLMLVVSVVCGVAVADVVIGDGVDVDVGV